MLSVMVFKNGSFISHCICRTEPVYVGRNQDPNLLVVFQNFEATQSQHYWFLIFFLFFL